MSDLKQKLAEAKAAYEAARAALDNARCEYEEGAGKRYTEIKKNIAELKSTIANHERAHQAAKDALAQVLRDSSGAMTAKAKEALAERRNAEDVLEECLGLLLAIEQPALALRFEASMAANKYRDAYMLASQAWASMNVYAVLAECGDRLCAAMAVAPDIGIDIVGQYDAHSRQAKLQEMPSKVLMAEVEKMVRSYEGDTRPYVSELGVYDLGAMVAQEIMSPAELSKARVATSLR